MPARCGGPVMCPVFRRHLMGGYLLFFAAAGTGSEELNISLGV